MDFMRLVKVYSRPIAFHRHFVDVTGSALDALFLSQCLYWTETLPETRDGWFYKTAEEWGKETGMSRRELETARKSLKSLGVLKEKKAGVPCVVHYRVDLATLQTRLDETYKLDCTKTPDLFEQNGQTPIRAENTAESTEKKIKSRKDRATEEELKEFCVSIGLPESDGRLLFMKWESTEWHNGPAPIRNWKLTVRRWREEGFLPSQKSNGNRNGSAKKDLDGWTHTS